MNEQIKTIDSIQQVITRTIATEAPGENLLLVGGFRYRLLNNSIRLSTDIDYHFNGNLSQKRTELLSLFKRRLIPEVKRTFGFDGTVDEMPSPNESESKTIGLAFYNLEKSIGRIEIPIDLTKITFIDKPETRTINGTIYLTVSDADMVESKILALLLRVYKQERDLIDLFLFKSSLADNVSQRLHQKMSKLGLALRDLEKLIASLKDNRSRHIKVLNQILETQVEEGAQQAIKMGGGAGSIFDTVLSVLQDSYNRIKKEPIL